MKKTFTLALLLFSLFSASAQHKKIDSLRVALGKAVTDTDKYSALYQLGKLYYISYPDSAIIFHQEAFLIAKKHNWEKEQGENFNGIANAYATMGDYATGIQYYLKGLKSYELADYGFGSAQIDNNIGATYVQKEDYKGSLPYLLRALTEESDYAARHKLLGTEPELKSIVLENLGECYLNLKELDSAKYYLDAAFKGAQEAHFRDIDGATLRDLGEVQELKENKTGALQYFRRPVISDRFIDDVENLSIAYLSISKFYHQNKITDSAIYYAQKALDTAAAGKYVQDVLNAGKALYTYYDEGHNLPDAYKYFKITTAAKDSLYSQDKVKQLLTLSFNEKQRREELEVARADAQNKVRIYILLGGLGILLLLALIFWRTSKQRQKANHLLKKQKEDIETAMEQLKSAQKQLIQSEKMASLGELTAGIAHEIQNPLNFVNNFSEVNTELLDEMQAEIDKGSLEEVRAIAIDLQENEKKINLHGKRADAIVKGMLQHSQSGSGAKAFTDISALADEYMRLAYHGLRAKDKSFNAEMVTHFDADLPPINVIPQDIGRVMLNLLNNAFYAVNQKSKTAGPDYKPAVTAETFFLPRSPAGVGGLRVKDNGVGIPDAIKEKIMQPFFTTKPTGEGTGLGLSLTYDIVVKGHGGKIEVNSKEGEFTEFIITLPL